jgi:hypothetical protein
VVGRAGVPLELRSDLVVLRDFDASDRAAFIERAADEAMYTWHGGLTARRPPRWSSLGYLFTRSGSHLSVVTGTWPSAHPAASSAALPASIFDRRGAASSVGTCRRRIGAGGTTALLLDLGFWTVGVRSVTPTCDPENKACRRVLDKCGLRYVNDKTITTWRGTRPRLRFQISRHAWTDPDA